MLKVEHRTAVFLTSYQCVLHFHEGKPLSELDYSRNVTTPYPDNLASLYFWLVENESSVHDPHVAY